MALSYKVVLKIMKLIGTHSDYHQSFKESVLLIPPSSPFCPDRVLRLNRMEISNLHVLPKNYITEKTFLLYSFLIVGHQKGFAVHHSAHSHDIKHK